MNFDMKGTAIPDDAKKRKRNDDETAAPNDSDKKSSSSSSSTTTGQKDKQEKNTKKNIKATGTDLPETQKTVTDKPKKVSTEQSRNLAALSASLLSKAPAENSVDGVGIVDRKIGDGAVAESGSRLKVNYIGRLKANNKVFDSSKKPFAFKLGRSEVIKGWDIGVRGMRVGGTRTLTIPPEKGYGRQGAPPTIPGNATLIFDVTLVEVK